MNVTPATTSPAASSRIRRDFGRDPDAGHLEGRQSLVQHHEFQRQHEHRDELADRRDVGDVTGRDGPKRGQDGDQRAREHEREHAHPDGPEPETFIIGAGAYASRDLRRRPETTVVRFSRRSNPADPTAVCRISR